MQVIHTKQKSNHKLGQSFKYCFLFLVLFISVSATIYGFVNGSASADTKNTDFTVNIRPVMNLTTSANQVSLNLSPASHVSDSQSVTTTVSTNNSNGYQLYISATSSSLVEKNNSSLTIPTLPASETGYASLADFPANHWGYKLNDGNFQAFEPDVLIGSATGPTLNASATVEFGAKIDYGTKAGQYELALNFKALPIVTQTYIQDVTPDFCTTDPQVVIDNRDGQAYTIQRLADGNCWMMTNLNLGAAGLLQDLTSANTNLATTITASEFKSYKKSSGTRSTTAAEYIPVSGTDSTSQTPYGTLYNYCAASAGTICTSSNSSDASYDICPKGWRLPTGGSSGEFQALYNNSSYNSYAKMHAPISQGGAAFALAGYFSDSTPGSQGSYGYYWSSTRVNSSNMHVFYLDTPSVYPVGSAYRAAGYSIRCVLDTRTISDVTNMQDVTSTVAANTAIGEVKTLTDTRDGQTYTVGKLKDGNIWMLQNLKLGKSTTTLDLTTADSDVSSTGFTLNGKLSDGKFTSTTVDGTAFQNNSSQYYCTDAYGCYYNWYTATAGAGTTSVSTRGTSVDYSICPKGWTLPTSGSGGQFQTLTELYGGTGSAGATAMLVENPTTTTENTSGLAAPGLLLGGSYNSSGADNIGSRGSYWSRTALSAQSGYYLNVYTTSVYPTGGNYKYIGRSVRCLAK